MKRVSFRCLFDLLSAANFSECQPIERLRLGLDAQPLRRYWRFLLTSSAIVYGVIIAVPAVNAQVAGDGSVGTRVNDSLNQACIGGSCVITGGTRSGRLLFHSFRQFSIPTGNEALFDAAGAQTIFSRVTGRDLSLIDGRLATLTGQSVALFLLNPNGIIFGPNATLNIGGSFVASTANSIVFENGAQFSATDRAFSPALLRVNVPIGLQFGSNPGSIQVQGAGNNLFLNPGNFEIVRDFRPPGLEVSDGETLALVGGGIRLAGGNLTAAQGRIELSSVGTDSFVSLRPVNPGWRLGYAGVEQFRDIHLTQAASIDASGGGGGDIQIRGRRVTLSDGSVLLTDTLGAVAGGNLSIRSDILNVRGISETDPLYSGIFADSTSTATGRGGNILIETGRLTVTEGGQISANTFGVGDAGRLTVRSNQIQVDGGSFLGPSGLFAVVAPGASGTGGGLEMSAQRLQISNGAQIAATSFGFGPTGTLAVTANEINLSGVFVDPIVGAQPSTLSVDMLEDALGQGGDLRITTHRLQISEGAQISSGTFGQGNAGSITVQAREIEVSGSDAIPFVTGILAPVAPGATGQGGTVRIQTERLTIADAGQIATSTAGTGNAGALFINASERVWLTGQNSGGRSGLFSSAVFGSGSGGNLTVNTDRLIVEDGATISVGNFPSTANSPFPPGQGSAGNLNLRARRILLDNQSTLTADTVVGDRANVDLQTELLTLRRGSQISTNATGTASGGNIRLTAPDGFIVAVPRENSDITANAVQGDGGRVDITAIGIYGIEVRPQLTSRSDITVSSDFGLEGVVTLETPYSDPPRDLQQLPESPREPELVQGCQPGTGTSVSRFTNIGRGGSPPQPTDPLVSRDILGDVLLPAQWMDQPTPSALGDDYPAGSASASVRSAPAGTAPIVEAQGWDWNDRGELVLLADLPSSLQDDRCF